MDNWVDGGAIESHVGSTKKSVKVQNESPQDMPLWHVDYFEPNATVTLWGQEKYLPPPP